MVRVEVDRTVSALLGMIRFREVGDRFFCRLELSAREMDETAQPATRANVQGRVRITARKRGTAGAKNQGQNHSKAEPQYVYRPELEYSLPPHCY